MIQLRNFLSEKYGSESYGRKKVVQMCQERGMDATTDEVTDEMWRAVK